MIVVCEDLLDEPFLDTARRSIADIPSQSGFDLSWLGIFREEDEEMGHDFEKIMLCSLASIISIYLFSLPAELAS